MRGGKRGEGRREGKRGGRERELSGDPSKMDPEKIQETIGHNCQSHRSPQSFRFAFHAAPALQMARHCAPDILHCVWRWKAIKILAYCAALVKFKLLAVVLFFRNDSSKPRFSQVMILFIYIFLRNIRICIYTIKDTVKVIYNVCMYSWKYKILFWSLWFYFRE